MATGTISSPGLGSNLDITTLVNNLMSLEKQPLTDLDNKEAALQAQITMLGGIKGALSTFQSNAASLQALAAKSSFRASPSDAAVLGATLGSTAGAGAYSVTVSQIAQAQRIASAGQASRTAAIGSGASTTLTISFGTISGGTLDADAGTYSGASFTDGGDTPVTVTLDSTNNTLEGIRDAINNAGAGVTASIVNDGSGSPYRLVLNANRSGSARSMKLEVSGDSTLSSMLAYDPAGAQDMTEVQAARDARATVDGIPVTSATNTVAGVIEGVTFSLKAAGTTTVTVSRDTSVVTGALTQLVASYNDANKAIADATAKGAQMQGNTGVVSMLTRLRSEIGALRPGLGSVQALSQLGVSFQRDGTLSLDSGALATALNGDYAGATAFLDKLAGTLSAVTNGMLGDHGSVQAQTDGLNRSIDDINERRDVLNRRLDATQQRYLAQFTALDTLISSMKQTSTFLEQQLANLPKIGSDK